MFSVRLKENPSRVVGQNSLTPYMNFGLARDQVVHLEATTNLWASRRKANDFCAVFLPFELEDITKHLMTGPPGNSEFRFPSTSVFPSLSPQEPSRGSGEQNSIFPLGSIIKCLLISIELGLRLKSIFLQCFACIKSSLKSICLICDLGQHTAQSWSPICFNLATCCRNLGESLFTIFVPLANKTQFLMRLQINQF